MPRDDRDWDDVRDAREEVKRDRERDPEWLKLQAEIAEADRRERVERDAEEKR